jgi:hypothetical protein
VLEESATVTAEEVPEEGDPPLESSADVLDLYADLRLEDEERQSIGTLQRSYSDGVDLDHLRQLIENEPKKIHQLQKNNFGSNKVMGRICIQCTIDHPVEEM